MESNRIKREKKIIETMIRFYCKNKHGSQSDLCPECQELLNYSLERLNRCKFGADKPVCSKCTVHCYKKAMRDKIKSVMRYSGPRMTVFHPIMAIQHYLDKLKK
ncbi:MAG: nitrous oxide-stimulated promoter family protein [Bacillota bacterium]|jgi:predicted amidophosphoribosyltransferase